MHDIIQDTPSAQHLIVDLLNEPDSKPAIASWDVVSPRLVAFKPETHVPASCVRAHCCLLAAAVHCRHRQLMKQRLAVSGRQCLTQSRTQMGPLYLSAMNAIYAQNPGQLFMIEGVGQLGFAVNWGDGFVTDLPTIRACACCLRVDAAQSSSSSV